MKNFSSKKLPVKITTPARYLLLTFIIIILITTDICAAAISCVAGGGPWNVASTWVGGVIPTGNDDVTIVAGASVTVPATGATSRTLTVNGNLNMTGSGITFTITNSSTTAAGLILGAGSNLFIGPTNTLNFSTTQGTGITNNGGTIASTGANGSDGGTILINTCCGGQFIVSGTASTSVYNFKFATNANFQINSGGLLVNGMLSVQDNNFSSSSSAQSPVYGPASTLYINWNNQGISGGPGPLNNNLSKLWSATSGTIGTTQGYPNNVTLVNMGNSTGAGGGFPNVGWAPTGAVGLNGTLRLGDGTTAGLGSLYNVTSFSSGGIIADNNSSLVSPQAGVSYTDKGDFILQGATTGVYYSGGATINFAGSGTKASPNIISTTGASGITFSDVKVSSGYVQLQNPVTITNTLNLAGGYMGTSSSNSLTVTNTANTAVTGGSSTSYVDGPLNWNLPASPSGNYVFPVGDVSNGPAYLPLTLSGANSSGGTTLTVQGVNQNSGGTRGDLAITSISPTEYWSVSSTNPLTSGGTVSVSRPTAVAPYNALASSSTVNGSYTLIGGTPSGNTISGGGISSSTPVYITMVNSTLTVVRIGGTSAGVDASCNPTTTGSLVVGGIGGTPPYTYSIAGFNGGAFQASNTFSPLAKGAYSVTIKDNTGTTKTVTLHVLGAVSINGNDQDIDICSGQSVTLTASNVLNGAPTYTWSPGGQTTSSITVNPVATTTYTVTSTVYANNLLVGGDFESGMPPSYVGGVGYTTYTPVPYPSTPGNGGYYLIGTAGNQLCTPFSTLPAESGSNYYIADGYINNTLTTLFEMNITGLTVGTVYRFSFWYAEGTNNPNQPQLGINVTGGTVTSGPGTFTISNYASWLQANYNISATATSMTISFVDPANFGTTNGNDIYLDNMQLLSPCNVSTSLQVTTNCTLPVELIYFNAKKEGTGALLTWQTVSEYNTSYFIIEKSTDGISFMPAGKVTAAGNSSALISYSFFDPFITTGETYYRLAEYDVDGSVHYSEVKVVSGTSSGNVLVIPNPNQGIFNVLLDNEGSAQMNIISSLGELVYTGLVPASGIQRIDISFLPSAVYYLRIITEKDIIVQKMVKE
jgi:hypothetical protein